MCLYINLKISHISQEYIANTWDWKCGLYESGSSDAGLAEHGTLV